MRARELEDILARTTGRPRTVSARTVQQLCKVIRQDETVQIASPARYESEVGMIVVTGHRILFCSAPLFGGVTMNEFGLRGLHSVGYRLGLTRGDVCFKIGREEVLLERLPKRAVRSITRSIGLAGAKPGDGRPEPRPEPGASILDRVEQLHRLHRDGALTEDEFGELKLRLFGEGAPQPDRTAMPV